MESSQSEQIDQLVAAIVAAQLKMTPAVKDHVNPYFKSKYADLPSVWEAAEPFRNEGVAITQSPVEAPEGFIMLDTQLSHKSGQWMRSRLKMRVAKDDPQGYGSALTYARRYALGCMTGIVTEEDDDGNAASTPQLKAQSYTQQKQTAQAKIAELRHEMQEPARQGKEVEDGGAETQRAQAPEHNAQSQQGPDALPPFIWRYGKKYGKTPERPEGTPIIDLPIDYLAWAAQNAAWADHKQAALDEIDRRQKQDHMNFEAQG